MANVNCLEGMMCPECGSEEPFRIAVVASVVMWDDGSDGDAGLDDLEWEEESYCKCLTCEHIGVVKDFTVEDPEDEDMQGPGPDADPQAFLNFWHQGQADGHWSSMHGCHEQCPVCHQEASQ